MTSGKQPENFHFGSLSEPIFVIMAMNQCHLSTLCIYQFSPGRCPVDPTIAQIIQDFDLDGYRPIAHRALDLDTPLEPRAGNLATVVMGVRRCGKTYRLFQEMDTLLAKGVSPERLLYFNFEDTRLPAVTPEVGDAVLQTYFELHPESYRQGAYLFLDEIQEMRDWDAWLRHAIDTTRATIYVTGSSSKLLSEEVASAFRGRSVTYELAPYGFGELVRLREPDLANALQGALVPTSEQAARAKHLFQGYLERGGFPAVQDVSLRRAVAVLQGYAQRAVAKDVIERHNLSNPQAMQAFARRLLATSGRTLSLRKVEDTLRSQGVSVGRNSLAQALEYFEDAFLVGTVRDFSRALAPKGNAMPKVYAVDHGLAMANSPAAAQDTGQRLESLVYNELRRRRAGGRPGEIAKLTCTQGNYEVDFLVGDALLQEGFELIQVCERVDERRTLARELRALDAAMAEQGLTEGWLLVGEGDVRELEVAHGVVHQLPVWLWTLKTAD